MNACFERTVFEGLPFFSRASMVAEGLAVVESEQAAAGLVTPDEFKHAVVLDRQAYFMLVVAPFNRLPA